MNDQYDDFGDEVAQHKDITQLDEWREEAKNAVLDNALKNKRVGGISDLDDSVLDKEIQDQLKATHGQEILERIAKRKAERSQLAAEIDLDETSTDEDKDRLDELDARISQLEHAIGV